MSNDKQSSVRWIVEELEKFELGTSEFYSKTAIINRGERMHKDEIEQAFANGVDDEYEYHINNEPRKNTEQYYNETFGGNNEQQ